ncbi:MAG: hypothetical protein AAGF71_08565 [Pseudomonadota bacterium]
MKNVLVLAPVLVVAASASYAQTSPAATDLATIAPAPEAGIAFPSVFGVASAVAPAPNSGYVGALYANPRGGIDGEGGDGDIFGGYTVGNAADLVALTVGLSVTSVSTDDFADSGALSASLSRLVNVSDRSATFIGATASNLAAWGDADDSDETGSIQISHIQDFDVPVQFTAGYALDNTYDDDDSGDLDDGFFLGVGVGISELFSISLSGTQTQANIGLTGSLPFLPNVGFSAGVFDVTDNVERQQFSFAVVYGF